MTHSRFCIPKHQTVASSRSDGAFTLIEMVIAIGILAVAVIPVVALAALSSNSDRDSQNAATSARIASDVIGVFQQADWQTISGWQTNGGPEFYYDIEGQVVANSDVASAGQQEAAAFTAKLHFPSATSLNSSTLQAIVLISSKPGLLGAAEITNALAPPGNSRVKCYPAIAVRLEKE